VVTRVESEAGREKREGASIEDENEVVEVLECMTGVVVERIPGFENEDLGTIELRGEEFGV
jgi:hypothetical protein